VSLFRREARQWMPEPTVPAFPGADGSGAMGAPSIGRAMQVSAVWACVRLLADSVSMMPLQSFTIRNGVRIPTPPPSFLVSPSSDASMPEWIYMAMVSALLRGNVFGQIVGRDSLGYPTQIELYNPDTVQCRTDTSGFLSYSVNGKPIPVRDMLHIRAFRMPGSRLGLSPIQYAAKQINTDAAVSDFAYGFFRDGAHPSAILSSDVALTQDQSRTAKDRFIAAIKGREPAVLSGGLKYTQVQVSPEESQFLMTQKYGVAEIARIFGVPPEMIAGEAGNSMTYANVEQRGIDFLTYSVQPWLTRFEAALFQLFPGQRHLRFDTSVLTRTDFQTTMTATAIGIASKQMTPDEARAKRDEPPLTDDQKADLALVPLEVGPTGKPKAIPPVHAEGEPA
jgi:HK97 family phage portal protein